MVGNVVVLSDPINLETLEVLKWVMN
jgi:hypothetical protein